MAKCNCAMCVDARAREKSAKARVAKTPKKAEALKKVEVPAKPPKLGFHYVGDKEVPIIDAAHPDYIQPGTSDYIKLLGHGGSCCGMKHIRNFWGGPKTVLMAREGYSAVKRPVERAGDRLAGVIKTQEAGVPKGILEIVLVPSEKNQWGDILLQIFDFRLVTEMVNSNTSNLLSVYHRSSGANDVRKIPKDFDILKALEGLVQD